MHSQAVELSNLFVEESRPLMSHLDVDGITASTGNSLVAFLRPVVRRPRRHVSSPPDFAVVANTRAAKLGAFLGEVVLNKVGDESRDD